MKNYYDSIHNLPYFYWDMINKSSDNTKECKQCNSCKSDCKFKFLMKEEISNGNKIPKNVNLENVWGKIFNEHLDMFGKNEAFDEWIELKKEYVKLSTRAYLNDEGHLITLAEVKERQAEELLNSVVGGSLSETIAIVSKFMGRRVNPMTETVAEVYGCIQLMEKSKPKSEK